MSKSYKNSLIGMKFGKLTVLSFFPNDKPNSYWTCRCDCGNIKIIRGDALITNKTYSCGCFQKAIVSQMTVIRNLTHGKRRTRLYNIWCAMKKRCYDKKFYDFSNYGGRGITVCDEWQSNFQAFYDWAMSNGYSNDLSIDRIDVNGNYEPLNCRWATAKAQCRNKRNNVTVEYDEQYMSLAEAAEQSNIPYGTLQDRYYRGDVGERLFRPIRPHKKYKKRKQ